MSSGAIATVTDSSFLGNRAIGGADSVAGGQAGAGVGGAIENGDSAMITVTGSSIVGNVAVGGAGSQRRHGGRRQGWRDPEQLLHLDVADSVILGNQAIGGAGGGSGEGGGVYNSGTASFSECPDQLNRPSAAAAAERGSAAACISPPAPSPSRTRPRSSATSPRPPMTTSTGAIRRTSDALSTCIVSAAAAEGLGPGRCHSTGDLRLLAIVTVRTQPGSPLRAGPCRLHSCLMFSTAGSSTMFMNRPRNKQSALRDRLEGPSPTGVAVCPAAHPTGGP